MNKIVLTLAAALVSTTALAAPANKNFTGAAVGAELGTTKYDTDTRLSAKNTKDVAITAGYGFEYGQSGFIGGVEGKVKPFKSKAFQGDNGKVEEKARYGVAYTQGYRVTSDFMPYVKAGVTESRFNNTATDVKAKARGYDMGVGAKYAVAPNVEVGAEYTHSRLRTKKDDNGKRQKIDGNSFSTGVAYRF